MLKIKNSIVFRTESESSYFFIKIVIKRYLLSREKDANFQKSIYTYIFFDRIHDDIIEQLRMSQMSNEKKYLPTPTWTLSPYPIPILQHEETLT